MKVLFVASSAVVLLATTPVTNIPFTDNGKLISVRTRIGSSVPMNFTVDTGASASVVDSGVASSLRLKTAGVRAGSGAGAGRVRFDVFRDLSLAVGEAHWVAHKAYGISLKGTGTEKPEAGLVGSDFFYRYVVRIDFDRRRLTLFEPSTFSYLGHGHSLPLMFAHHRPFITVVVKVAGRPATRRTVLIDSGSEDMLDDDIIASSTAKKRVVSGGVGLGKRFNTVLGPIEWVSVANCTISGLSGVSGGVPLMGQGILRRFNITLDYRHGRAYFEPRHLTS